MSHTKHERRLPKIYKVAALLVAIGIFAGSYFYYWQVAQAPLGIMDFKDTRDTSFILDIFDKDWYWLVAADRENYSPEYMLQHRASSKKPHHEGNLTIKTGYQDGEPTGFIAYFKRNFYTGEIRFIDVLPDYRKQGWGKKLMQYAINDLKKRGVSKIYLVTRTSNTAAQALYKRLGFKEIRTHNGFVDFELKV